MSLKTKHSGKFRKIALAMSVLTLFQAVAPTMAYALTSGPSQPEVQAFEPFGTSEMVDLFSGDFTYNIPLFELPGPNGGYPFNLAYHSGVGMDQEATWVGLGWSLNPGAINRNMRGLPDDFNGDEITKRVDMKPDWTVGVKYGGNFELFGADPTKSGPGISLGNKIYYNNYRGIGYGIEAGASFHKGGIGFGANLTMDSREGVGLNPSIAFTGKGDDMGNTSFNMGIGINSKSGLQSLTLGTSYAGHMTYDKKGKSIIETSGGSQLASISFSQNARTPSQAYKMTGTNLTFTFKQGFDVYGVDPNYYVGGFYSLSKIKNANKEFDVNAFGYLNNHHSNEESLLDFNREKDGLIRKESPNVGIPNMTFDSYSILGQGVGGMFRPYRSDIPTLHDREINSNSGGIALGLDLGFPNPSGSKVGFDLSINYSRTHVGSWKNPGIQTASSARDFEPSYYKVYGESTLERKSYYETQFDIGGEDLVKLDLSNAHEHSNTYNGGNSLGTVREVENGSTRKPRNQVVQPYTNLQLLGDGNSELLNEFKVGYFSSLEEVSNQADNPTHVLDRSVKPKSHNAGFTILNTAGLRYNYGLPVYNLKQVDMVFSVDGSGKDACDIIAGTANLTNPHNGSSMPKSSDKFLERTELPPYSTSHLLTSILGTDYVDLTGDGISEDDLGYWVKFNYFRPNETYNWRAPFKGENFIQGSVTKISDDKASHLYGEKETYYLASVESKTHIAVFDMSERIDAKGVQSETNSSLGASSYKLDQIKLYSKNEYSGSASNPTPIKTVNFSYSYDLCPNVQNNVNYDPNYDLNAIPMETPPANSGKLTLNNVWFTYEDSQKGALNKYAFDYLESNLTANPVYNRLNQDRWGNYKNYENTSCEEVAFIYTDQGINTDRDIEASAWCLRTITTPSGSDIQVEYESDDYAYVQNKVAGQMFKIEGLGYYDPDDIYDGSGGMPAISHDPSRIYEHELIYDDDDIYRRIYFKLEEPISNTLSAAEKKEILDGYFAGLRTPDGELQLYYSIFVNLRKSSEGVQERVGGYATIKEDSWGLYPGTNDVGYLVIEKTKIGKKERKFHPFALASWQFIRTNFPDLASTPGNLKAEPGTSDMAKVAKAKQLASAITQIGDLFTDYYRSRKTKNWASSLAGQVGDDGDSWIRLSTPDKIKYGGGHRVKSITINDGWNFDAGVTQSEYGVVYSYETNIDDELVSSGVAQYEPALGGDEISLKYAKNYPERIPLESNNNLFFEYPINESYYPGASVGYSKVTVRSLASDQVVKGTLSDLVPTTGEAVHQFYTAKSFPVITEETSIDKIRSDAPHFIPIPFCGSINIDDLAVSQGYKIELNDMHGKPKSIQYYAQNTDGDIIKSSEVSSVWYKYRTDFHNDENGGYLSLNNTLEANKVLTGEGEIADGGVYEIGTEYDFFVDKRKSSSISSQGGVMNNLEVLVFGPVVIPAPSIWFNIGYSQNVLNVLATNKVIHKTGVLESTTVFDGYSTLTTKNEMYDLTGKPVLTTVQNDFENPVYNYNIPAHWSYEGMGAAYKNIGLEFSLGASNSVIYNTDYEMYETTTSNDVIDLLNEGDEFICYHNDEYKSPLKGNIEYVNRTSNTFFFVIHDGTLDETLTKHFLITRSGKRNHLSADAGNIVALSNPIVDRLTIACQNIGSAGLSGEYIAGYNSFEWVVNPDFIEVIEFTNYLAANGDLFFRTCLNSDENSIIQNKFDLLNSIASQYQTTPFQYDSYNFFTNQSPYLLEGNLKSVCGNVFNFITSPVLAYPPPTNNICYRDLDDVKYKTGPRISAPNLRSLYVSCQNDGDYWRCDKCLNIDTDDNGSHLGPNDLWSPRSEQVYSSYWTNNGAYKKLQSLSNTEPSIDFKLYGSPDQFKEIRNLRVFPGFSNMPSRPENQHILVDVVYENSNGQETTIEIASVRGGWSIPATKKIYNTPIYDNFNSIENCSDLTIVELIDGVISTSAVKYSDTWIQDFNDAANVPELDWLRNVHLYQSGQKGVWRAESSFTYVEDRSSNLSASLTDKVNLELDGIYDDVSIFQWNNPNFLDCPETEKWKQVNTITKYSPYSFEVENKDVLDNYSSALYSYEGNLSIGTAVNAKYNEIGFESFEEYEPNEQKSSYNNATGHLDFVQSYTSTRRSKNKVGILSATDNILVLNKPYDANDTYSKVIVNAVYSDEYKDVARRISVSDIQEFNGNTLLVLASSPVSEYSGECFTGYVYLDKPTIPLFVNTPFNEIVYTDEKAHTGKISCKVPNLSIFLQPSLELEEGKTYVLDSWVSRDNINTWSFAADFDKRPEIYINFWDENDILLGYSDPLFPSGNIIEEWQKITGEFTVPVGTDRILITLAAGHVPSGWLGDKVLLTDFEETYFDDIRIHPKEGNMQTYVYDNLDYKLRAVLDENNYATMYSYDNQGSLFLVKKETAKGVKTIQESRVNVKPN